MADGRGGGGGGAKAGRCLAERGVCLMLDSAAAADESPLTELVGCVPQPAPTLAYTMHKAGGTLNPNLSHEPCAMNHGDSVECGRQTRRDPVVCVVTCIYHT